MFKNESQLRTLWDSSLWASRYYIEPGIGSTFGLPDTFCLLGGGQFVFAELKRGELNGRTLRFTVRKAQKQVIPRLMGEGAKGVVAVAQVGAATVHVFDPQLIPQWQVLSGKVDLDEAVKFVAREPDAYEWEMAPSGLVTKEEFGTVGGVGVTWVIYGCRAVEVMREVGFKGFGEWGGG